MELQKWEVTLKYADNAPAYINALDFDPALHTFVAVVPEDVIGAGGKAAHLESASVARTDATPKGLFTLPAGALIHRITIFGAVQSNAGATATLSVGKTGSDTFFVNAMDVKGVTGLGQQVPAASNLGSVGEAQIQVVGVYAETGTPSTTGGPWTVFVEYTI